MTVLERLDKIHPDLISSFLADGKVPVYLPTCSCS